MTRRKENVERVRRNIQARNGRTVNDIARFLDLNPRFVRAACAELRERGEVWATLRGRWYATDVKTFQGQILDILRQSKYPMSAGEVRQAGGGDRSGSVLSNLARRGLVKREGAPQSYRYSIPSPPESTQPAPEPTSANDESLTPGPETNMGRVLAALTRAPKGTLELARRAHLTRSQTQSAAKNLARRGLATRVSRGVYAVSSGQKEVASVPAPSPALIRGRVFAALTDKPRYTAAIASQADVTQEQAAASLGSLVRDGLARRCDDGVFKRTEWAPEVEAQDGGSNLGKTMGRPARWPLVLLGCCFVMGCGMLAVAGVMVALLLGAS